MADDDKALNHAWAYFALHANQRITVFNYFVVFAGVLCTGIAATLQASPRFATVGVALGLLLVAVSFLFWKLDQRTSFLIKHSEDVIKQLEPSLARLMTDEVDKTKRAKKKEGIWTYGRIFRLIFGIMAAVGLVGAVLAGLRAARQFDWSDAAKGKPAVTSNAT